jgi:PAS domain S-box-containing protein
LKRVEGALRDSERRWRDLAEAMPQLVWTCTPDGPCDFLSRQWVAYTGKAEAEQLGYGWLEQVHPDDRDRLTGLWGEAVATGHLFDVEVRIRRADGAYRWFKTRAVPVRGADGRVAKWFGSNTDIEDLKRATESLHESEERFRAFMDNTSAVAWMKDEQGRYAYLNQPFEKHFGVRLEDWRGKTDPEVWPAEVAGQFRRNDQEVIQSGQPREVVEQTLSADGRLRTWLTSKFPFRDAAGRTFVGGIGFDITERRELEREVLEIAALEQRRIGQELHDSVGQELTGLGLFADALAQRLAADSPAAAAQADKLVQGIGRVRRQVRSLSHGLVPVEVDPEGLRAALEQLAASTAEASGCACTFEGAAPIDVADPDLATQLYRIAQEAVSNSLRHGRPRRVRIALRSEPGALTLSVEDDGVGLPTTQQDGKGLGLRLMHYRAGIVGGTLTAARGEWGGTVVTCRVPRGTGHDHQRDGRQGAGDQGPHRR